MKQKRDDSSRLTFSSDDNAIIKACRKKGMTDEKIVLVLTRGETYESCQALARRYAPLLGIGLVEFMVLARRRSR